MATLPLSLIHPDPRHTLAYDDRSSHRDYAEFDRNPGSMRDLSAAAHQPRTVSKSKPFEGEHAGLGDDASGRIKTPRPPNAWILYRSARLRLLKEANPLMRTPQGELSKTIAESWRNEDPNVKKWYEQQAEMRKLEHAEVYPSYKFQPRLMVEPVRRVSASQKSKLKKSSMKFIGNAEDPGATKESSIDSDVYAAADHFQSRPRISLPPLSTAHSAWAGSLDDASRDTYSQGFSPSDMSSSSASCEQSESYAYSTSASSHLSASVEYVDPNNLRSITQTHYHHSPSVYAHRPPYSAPLTMPSNWPTYLAEASSCRRSPSYSHYSLEHGQAYAYIRPATSYSDEGSPARPGAYSPEVKQEKEEDVNSEFVRF